MIHVIPPITPAPIPIAGAIATTSLHHLEVRLDQLDDEIKDLMLQIDEAANRFRLTGEKSDPIWFSSTKSKLIQAKHERKQVARMISDEKDFYYQFYRVASQVIPKVIMQQIVASAKLQRAQGR